MWVFEIVIHFLYYYFITFLVYLSFNLHSFNVNQCSTVGIVLIKVSSFKRFSSQWHPTKEKLRHSVLAQWWSLLTIADGNLAPQSNQMVILPLINPLTNRIQLKAGNRKQTVKHSAVNHFLWCQLIHSNKG